MRLTQLKNSSGESVPVRHGDYVTHLAPGDTMKNVDVDNFDEIKERVTSTHDLGEVNEHKGHIRLCD